MTRNAPHRSSDTPRRLLMMAAAASVLVSLSCGGSSVATDTVTLCTPDQCVGPAPLAETHICPDQFVAGPACIKVLDGTCDWAVLTCGVKRGLGSGGLGGNVTGTGGQIGSGGIFGTGGKGSHSSGGAIGSGGFVSTGGIIGSGGFIATGGIIGSGGFIATGGIIGSGGFVSTGGIIGTGGIFGSGGSFGSGGVSGSFSWTGQGQSQSTFGSYDENLALSGKSFIITIAADYQFLFVPCHLTGQFASVPPPPGTYPISSATTPQVDGTFIGRCTTYYGASATDGDPSISGTVILAQSIPGDIEGSFTMHATQTQPNWGTGGSGAMGGVATGTGGVTGTVIYTGAFAVGCRDGLPVSDPACAARTIGK